MMMRPIGSRVLVRREEVEEKAWGGILLPETAQRKPLRGRVVSMGPGRTLEDGTIVPVDLAVGDRVVFGQHSGAEIEVEGEKLLMLHEAEIFGVLG